MKRRTSRFTDGPNDTTARIGFAMYRALAEHCPDIIVCYDLQARRTYVNPAYERLAGTPAEEAIGKHVTEGGMFPPDITSTLERIVADVAATGVPAEIALAWPQENGDEVCFDLHAVPERGEDGRTIGVLTFARDVTAYRRTEAELRARAAEFRALAENSPDSIVRYDLGVRRIYINPAYERFSGIAVASAIGKTPIELSYLPPAEAKMYQQKLSAVMSSGVSTDFELSWKRPDGRRGLQHIVAVPERGQDGAVTSVLTIARDISDLKEVQRRLEKTEAMAHLGYWQWDYRTKEGSISAEVCRIFGKAQDWSPSLAEIQERIMPEERDWVWATIRVALASQSHDISLECRIQGDDRIIDVHSSIRVEYDAEGKPLSLVGTIQDVSEIKHYEERVHALAYYDVLTGLPNRELFADRLRQATDTASSRCNEVGVLVLDLDNFKVVNDTLGHSSGDQLLRETAARLRCCVREYDTVARLGGDEFGFVLADLPPRADLGNICRNILNAIGEPYLAGDREIFLTGSIGIARYPADACDVSSLLQYADAAMYHAKGEGRNNYQFYAASLTRRIAQRLNLAASLRRAETNGELELYYQPQIDLGSGRLVGAEALLRWNHPEQGLLTPDRFIDIAEETGFIVSIGAWVLRTACEAARTWNSGRQTPLKIAVNLSPRQFKAKDFVATVAKTLSETGCAPEWLELEITESILVDDADNVGKILDALHAMNVSIAIDDFGTGYSALGYLNRFRVDVIKIDRSFVRDIASKSDCAALVRAIIAMAHSLRLNIVAEGIEEKDQEFFLRDHGCGLGQGFLYGRPMPYRDFKSLTSPGKALPARASK